MRRLVLLPDFLPQVNASVVDRQVIVAPEALATFFALVGLLTCDRTAPVKRQRHKTRQEHRRRTRVGFLMLGQVIVADEGFAALVALVALVVVVNPQVQPVGAAVPEALAADAAQVRLLAAVDPQVLLQRGPVGGVGGGQRGYTHTHTQDAEMEERSPLPHRLATDEAGPLPLASVRALHVPLPVARVVELASTDLAGERTWRDTPHICLTRPCDL